PADAGAARQILGTGLLGQVDAAASLGGGLVFRSEIPARHWVFADHRVRGRSILPASGLIAMALEAGRLLYGDGPIGIEDLRFVKPLEGESGASLVTELREDGALTVSSGAGPHLTCRLTGVGHDDRATAESDELAASAHRIDGPAFYARCAEAGLVFGPRFRRLREVSGDGTVAVGRIEGAVQGFDAGWLDAVLQTVGGREAGTSLNARRAVMPVAADRIECFAALPAEAEARARLGTDGRFTIDVTDKDGGLVLRIAGLAFVELAAPAQAAADSDALDIYLPGWKIEAAPADTGPENVAVLGGAGAPGLVRALLHRHPGARSLALDGDPGDADLVYWLGALDTAVGDSLPTSSEVALAEERVLLPLLRRLKPLVGKPGHLKVVADRGHGFASGDPVRPIGAAALGLTKAAAREAAPLSVSAIDIDLRDDPDEIARGLAAEPSHGDGEDIALRRGLRWRRILERAALEGGDLPLREGGCYVILGGAGGLGRVLSRHLAERWRARLVWIGRRAEDGEIRAALAEVRAAGGEAIYLSADAGDAEALRTALAEARGRFGDIHGVVHSALVLRDSLVAGMGEADLLEVLAPKTRGIAVLVEALGDAPLDFLCLFSSAISFSGNAGQANYAAASQFIDAYASGLRAAATYPVVTIDWGYWGETGIVADEATRRRMNAQGVLSIEAGSGMEAFERLLANGVGQAMPIRLAGEKRVAMADPASVLRRGGAALPARLPRAVGPAEENGPAAGEAYESLDRYARRRLAEVLRFALPAAGARDSLDEIRARLALSSKHEALFAALIEMLVREGIARTDGETLEIGDYPVSERPVAPAVRAHLVLLDQCLDGLGDLLAGRCEATQLLFPGGDRDKVQAVYRGNPTMAACDAMLGELAADFITGHAGEDPVRRFRILEIGGGTGAATHHVLAALAGLAGRIDYDFTDVSRSFASQAEAAFGKDYPFVRFGALDIASPPGGQGFDTGSYDLVIASNVLHAVGDLSAALGHAKSLLTQGGLLLVNEVTARFDAVTLTFGLTPEWWTHDGGDGRLLHAPLLSVPLWRDRLAAEGFGPLVVHSPGTANPDSGGQAIFAALGDGWMRLPVAVPSRPVVVGTSEKAAPPASADTGRTLAVLRQVFGKVLGMTEVELDVDATFETFGVDSLVVMDINRALEARFGPVPATILYEARTLRALADRLAETFADTVVAAAAAVPPEALRAEPVEPTPPPVSARPETVARPSNDTGAADEPIAIIGMACRFPGAADPEQFWELLREGRSAIGEVPISRWDWRETGGGARGEAGRHYTKFGGFLADAGKFDPLFFGISPQEAETLDPQERLFLETAWHALEDAGYPAPVCKGQAVGVYVGVMNAGYEWLSGRASAQSYGGDAHSAYWSVANRVTYCFDFTGPSMAVDTACSSSLTALHLACDALRRGDCETAIAGGVNVIAGPVHFTRLCNLGMVSEGPDCKSFGDEADGFVDGEGVGAVMLKPLSRALADGDFIHGVLRGSAINAGGKTGGYTVPNPRAQAQVVARALDRSGLTARDISYVEAHGTGTALGDPIEIAGLKEAFAGDTRDIGFCAVGSVKSNIGHLESA
ncbi:MAG: SDR family NAD(P)-dependent oxidoreductase, partial [Proteobacteria bacterium]|nr:SDR family NAD(P)-dependent oxidoreductase [Pseudomonadota bacterium]